MDLAQLIVSRRTVHNYKSDKVADALVEKALELSLWAPNHKLTFPWRYFWVGPETRARLIDLAIELKAAKKPVSEVEEKAVRETFTNPAHIILLGIANSEDPKRMHEDYASLACAVQIASLYLWEKGVASKWTTTGFTKHARTYEILGLRPNEVQLEGALMIGTPLKIPSPSARPSLDKLLRRIE